ncbi:MAG TPA: bifunctional 4-hydroxy-2-oxoglutarate aldolase/2-dehydro-3-deoxy-phosphogluconate aldolase [Burkholderiaceae bacterium]|nr:bifunctional 4-hydroxy-2-oxoglutarate aldolase/2-dehydro-3-deoxy-phosphogluconate aldolase [Burkholderiaceae bacterium]
MPASNDVSNCPLIPVIVLHDADDAVPLARALLAGGVSALEITLRSDAGLESIRRVAAEVPEALVGAGTVTRPDELQAIKAAGARFAFSPGWSVELSDAARQQDIVFLPGVMTPSEVMAAANRGHRAMKLFPAAVAGGIAMLRALGGPFAGIRFCPTGGVDAENFGRYLALPNVFAVGGSWLVPEDAIRARDWERITALSAKASAEVAAVRQGRSA